ncbi:tannase/feruloyl esterase family alpha/beta hydrolase [Pokkaliibacter sp. MBI-7]|uniref:tannase/feruloyl esterase family alpha/beta hydrolase n=1 Tax=Pokkaliibacter sp. MBI-7 TaxID=3040600 RepID=UPI00244740CF|nr:tannase/feruloyl esterase family alpha/beta hydrolase [Pokkaliibacter sp. MBI-7]MDH2434999.1 tannase/feruloyl esterase family alpha/beta hydrolase [Pokkaliibacter sp. MBI-7]
MFWKSFMPVTRKRPITRCPLPMALMLSLSAPTWAASTKAPLDHQLQPTMSCEALRSFPYASMKLSSTELIAAGSLSVPGIAEAMPEHCLGRGELNERVSPVDGKRYAIGFEMRLPSHWNGRFFYQANGGLDGRLVPAYGGQLGGGPDSNGLLKGFAVISSDAGHAMEKGGKGIGAALFGLDPQARKDYGYNAVAQLTPMARQLITGLYGYRPARSYLLGASNGGRHAMVAAARDTGQYDGIVAGDPGFNLPQAAVAQVWGAQQFARVASLNAAGKPDLETSFTPAQLKWVAQAVLQRCDGLDGLKDGLIFDMAACQRHFDIQRDVASCQSGQTDHCLDEGRKRVLQRLFAGPHLGEQQLYSAMPWDSGIDGQDWRDWKLKYSVGPRDAIALGFVFMTPPVSPAVVNGEGTSLLDYALNFSLEQDAPRIYASNSTYTEAAMTFMPPPQAAHMDHFIQRGGKLIVFHGNSDPVFSALDTVHWYQALSRNHGKATADSVRLFLIPGMNHTRYGPATDQFDMLDAIVAWVEQGKAPQRVIASARGQGSLSPNTEIPADWSAQRSRPLCPYPQLARYDGKGDPEQAASFLCQ